MIFVTLVGEGLTLPAVVRALGLANAGRREREAEREEEFKVRKRAIEAAIERLEAVAESRKLPEPVVAPIRAHLRNRLKDVENRKDGNDHHKKLAELGDELELALIGAERELANTLYRTGELKDEGRRRIERELDLREAVLANLRTRSELAGRARSSATVLASSGSVLAGVAAKDASSRSPSFGENLVEPVERDAIDGRAVRHLAMVAGAFGGRNLTSLFSRLSASNSVCAPLASGSFSAAVMSVGQRMASARPCIV